MYHDYHEKIEKFDPYTDFFFLFSPGIGHHSAREGWKPSIQKALETKCAMFITGYDEADMMNDVTAVEQDYQGEFDWVLKPTVNEYRSLKRDVNLMDLRQTIFANYGIWGIRDQGLKIRIRKELRQRRKLPESGNNTTSEEKRPRVAESSSVDRSRIIQDGRLYYSNSNTTTNTTTTPNSTTSERYDSPSSSHLYSMQFNPTHQPILYPQPPSSPLHQPQQNHQTEQQQQQQQQSVEQPHHHQQMPYINFLPPPASHLQSK
ncbi:hypothetical protein RMATCC62417_14939 [Rhizopus microsporus]|nr:hypothetical protein RMATCC62417_14939 [Rhizopus microsporus]